MSSEDETDNTPEAADNPTGDPPDTASKNGEDGPRTVAYRGATSDPTFGYLLALALSIGLTPLLPDNADLRYTVTWGALALFGVLAWLMGNSARIERETPENLGWGIIFGVIVGAPILAFGGSLLTDSARLMFPAMSTGTVLAYLLFVMPLGETLFFRAVLQENVAFLRVGLQGSLWSIVLFFPVIWGDLLSSPAVGVLIALVLVLMNLIYSYVRQRNGLAAAWVCQIVVNLVVVFLPFL